MSQQASSAHLASKTIKKSCISNQSSSMVHTLKHWTTKRSMAKEFVLYNKTRSLEMLIAVEYTFGLLGSNGAGKLYKLLYYRGIQIACPIMVLLSNRMIGDLLTYYCARLHIRDQRFDCSYLPTSSHSLFDSLLGQIQDLILDEFERSNSLYFQIKLQTTVSDKYKPFKEDTFLQVIYILSEIMLSEYTNDLSRTSLSPQFIIV